MQTGLVRRTVPRTRTRARERFFLIPGRCQRVAPVGPHSVPVSFPLPSESSGSATGTENTERRLLREDVCSDLRLSRLPGNLVLFAVSPGAGQPRRPGGQRVLTGNLRCAMVTPSYLVTFEIPAIGAGSHAEWTRA